MNKLRVVFAGTPAFALPPLRALLAIHDVVGVMTQPDRPAGRGRMLTASAVKAEAVAHGMPVLQPARLAGDPAALAETLSALTALRPDVIVVVAYGLILPQAVLDLPRLGCLNIHASRLPRWRGAAPIQRSILAGDALTGVVIMQMDAGLDTGDMLLAEDLAIGAGTTGGELHDQLATLGAKLIVQALADCAAGTAHRVPQPGEGITYAAKLSKAEALIDWTRSSSEIDRMIRGFNPWPGAETRHLGEPLKLLRSRVAQTSSIAPPPDVPGTVLGLQGDALQVVCGQGIVQVLELQRAGRKPIGARDFFNAGRGAHDASMVWG